MPELPEVETVRRTLGPLVGIRIESMWTSGKSLRLGRPIDTAALEAATVGRRVDAVRRLGKYLLVDLRGSERSVLVHLGMSGRLRLVPRDSELAPHTHVVFELERRSGLELRYSDPRRFGQVDTVLVGDERSHPALAVLGPDPLEDGVDPAHLHAASRRTRRAIKQVLLDQSVLAGIGNIYASEALFSARIHPSMPGNRLSRKRAGVLARAVVAVLEHALERGGTSLRDFVNADGQQGENAHYLRVYDREGVSCPRRGCRGTVRRKVIQGRATFYCPTCQSR